MYDGYLLVSSEVEFLRLATLGDNLLVKGPLCAWAESFCRGRDIECRKLMSPQLEIQDICSGIETDHAKDLYEYLGQRKFELLNRPLTVTSVLSAAFPSPMWDQEPSYTHAADWLLWLLETKPSKCFKPLFQAKCEAWKSSAYSDEKKIYSATDEDLALDTLERWVGLKSDPSYQGMKDFPRPIPARIKSHARQQWKRLMVETQGMFLRESMPSFLNKQLKASLVEEAYQYLKNNRCKTNLQNCIGYLTG